MAKTNITGSQILDGTVGRADVDTTSISQSVITKVIAGTNVTLSYTGADAGTGDVTVNFTGGGGSARVAWGPDFGEDNGADGVTRRIGVSATIPTIAIQNTKTIGVNLAMPTIELSSIDSIGVHLSGTAIGAPFWQSVSTNVGVATSLTVNKPTGTQIGDLLLAYLACWNPTTPPTINVLTGWTDCGLGQVQFAGTAAAMTARCIYRVADGTEGTSFTFGGQISEAQINRISSVSATTPINAVASATLAASALITDPVSPSLTTTAPNCLVFAFLSHYHAATSQTHTAPASHIERTDFESNNSSLLGGQTSDTRVFAASAAVGTATHDCTETAATDAIMMRVAIAPGVLILAT